MAFDLLKRRYRSRRQRQHTVTELRAEGNYTLWLRFDDGLEGRVYLGDLVTSNNYGVLSDEQTFCRVAIDPVSNAVTWEGGLYIEPDTLYRDVASKLQTGLH